MSGICPRTDIPVGALHPIIEQLAESRNSAISPVLLGHCYHAAEGRRYQETTCSVRLVNQVCDVTLKRLVVIHVCARGHKVFDLYTSVFRMYLPLPELLRFEPQL